MSEEKRDYNFEGRKFFAVASGKEVAALNDQNNVDFGKGMAQAHKNQLNQWMLDNGMKFGNMPVQPDTLPGAKQNDDSGIDTGEQSIPQDKANTDQPQFDKKEKAARKRMIIADIPEDQLPPFDKRLGRLTPRLQEYIDYHQLDDEQTKALIIRLENKK